MKKIILLSLNFVLLCSVASLAVPRPKNASNKNARIIKMDGKTVVVPIRNSRI